MTVGVDWSRIRSSFALVLRFMKRLAPYWDKQVVLYICTFFSMILGIISPYLTRAVIDFAFIGRDLHLFNRILLVGVALYLFSIPIELIRKNVVFYLRTRVSLALRSELYGRLHALSIGFAQSRPVGERMYRLGPDIDGVVGFILDTAPGLLVFAVRFSIILGICIWLNWQLTLLIALAAPAFYFHTWFFTRRQYAIGKAVTEESQNISARLQEALASVKLIKVFARERAEHLRYMNDMVGLVRLNVKNLRLGLLKGESVRFMHVLVTGYLSYVIGLRVIDGSLTLGQMTALSMYLFQLLSLLRGVGDVYNDTAMRFISMERVVQTLDAETEVKEPLRPVRFAGRRSNVSVESVRFGYALGNPILVDVKFNAEPGQMIAVVGPSGAGKTTLAQLLIRLHDPWGGRILLGGCDIRKLGVRELRRAVGLVPHDASLLRRSVRDNIAFGNPRGATREEVAWAVRMAEACEFIEAFPRGIETVLGENGFLLSQGQKQRISIARALLMRPKVLILDEAMAYLESECEQKIIENIRRHCEGCILFVISHRLSSLRFADNILVFDNGRLVEEGSHWELVGKGGLYGRLYGEQHPVGSAISTPARAHGGNASH